MLFEFSILFVVRVVCRDSTPEFSIPLVALDITALGESDHTCLREFELIL